MRTLLIGALAETLVGCSCPLPPQAGIQACIDANRFACFDKTASQPIEPKPASFEANSATIKIKSTVAAKAEKPSSAHVRDRDHLATKAAKSATAAAKVEPPTSGRPAGNPAATATAAANTASSPPKSGSAAGSNTRTTQEQAAVATAVPVPEQKSNNTDPSDHSETVLRADTERTAPAPPNNTDHLFAILMARSEI